MEHTLDAELMSIVLTGMVLGRERGQLLLMSAVMLVADRGGSDVPGLRILRVAKELQETK